MEGKEVTSGQTCNTDVLSRLRAQPVSQGCAGLGVGTPLSYLAPTSPVFNMRMRRVACV